MHNSGQGFRGMNWLSTARSLLPISSRGAHPRETEKKDHRERKKIKRRRREGQGRRAGQADLMRAGDLEIPQCRAWSSHLELSARRDGCDDQRLLPGAGGSRRTCAFGK